TASTPDLHLDYPEPVESAVTAISARLNDTPISPRSLALMWLSRDPVSETWMKANLDQDVYQELCAQRDTLQQSFAEPLSVVIQQVRLEFVDQTTREVLKVKQTGKQGFSAQLGRLTTHPVWGLFILAAVLYGLYWFVGVFGAGTLVDLLEENLFGEIVNPAIIDLAYNLIPSTLIADFLVGEYGLW